MEKKKYFTNPITIHIITIIPVIFAIFYYYTHPATLEAIYTIIIALVVTLLLSNINSQFLIQRNIEKKIEDQFEKIQKNNNLANAGIVDFAKGESRQEKYEKIAKSAKKEILVCGIGFSNFVQDLDKIEKLIKRLDKYKILMLDPKIFSSPNMESYLKEVSNKENVKSDVKANYQILKDFQKKLYKEKRNLFDKLEFRVYNSIPTMTFFLTDPNSANSKMVIDLLPTSCAVKDRPMIILEPHNDDDLYHFLLPKFEKIWNESEVVKVENA